MLPGWTHHKAESGRGSPWGLSWRYTWLALSGGRHRSHLKGLRAELFHLTFQRRIIIERRPVDIRQRSHAPLFLLDNVPGLMWQMLFLAWGNVDVRSLRIGRGLEFARFC